MSEANFSLCRTAGYFYTYLHRRVDTGEIFYVGKGRGRRALTKSGRSEWWRRIAVKHGFTVEIIAPWNTEAEAFEHEIFLIDTFRSMGCNLVNLSNGGDGPSGHVHSEETKAKRAASLAIVFSDPEMVEKRLSAMRAAKSTPEHRALTSERMRAQRGSAAARAKQSADTKAAWSDQDRRGARVQRMREVAERPEVRERLIRISRARRDDPVAMAAAAEHLRAMNASKAKPVICITTGVEYASCTAAAEAMGLKKHSIKEVCLGRYTQTRGLKFQFKPQIEG